MNKKFIKNLICRLYPVRYSSGVLILNYHSINPNHRYSTKPEDFDEQMNYIAHNFNVIRLGDIDNQNNKLSIIITFDDGFADNYEHAFPILKKYNLPATVFLVSDFIFNNLDITKHWVPYNGLKPLTESNIKEMSDSGLIDFGSHGKNHNPASSLSENIFKSDLIESINKIQACSGKRVDSYAFPFGQKSQRGFFDLNFFKKIGFSYICTTDWGLNKKNYSNIFLKRIRIDGSDTLKEFQEKISGSWDFVSLFQYIKNLKWHLKRY